MNPEISNPEHEQAAKLAEMKAMHEQVCLDLDEYEKLVYFSQNIKAQYPDHDDYRTWHVISGSGIIQSCSHFDFPGDDSVEKHLRELTEENNRPG